MYLFCLYNAPCDGTAGHRVRERETRFSSIISAQVGVVVGTIVILYLKAMSCGRKTIIGGGLAPQCVENVNRQTCVISSSAKISIDR